MLAGAVTVSMYNVGFGDCFLLTFPHEDGRDRRMLIDCGSIKKGDAGAVDEVVEQLVDDITVDGAARIDVVAVSHRHRDHISGFASERWAEVDVGEVWLPWTEQPDDDRAIALRASHERLATALAFQMGFDADDEDTPEDPVAHAVDNVLFAARNETSMATLRDGFAGSPTRRYLSRSSRPRRPRGLPRGVRVHVLGPSTDLDTLTRMHPPAAESFLRVAGPDGDTATDVPSPFASAWHLFEEDISADYEHLTLDDVPDRLKELGFLGAQYAAAGLENAVNNTSLMLMIEAGDAFLLFPGDAQWGAWELVMEHPGSRRLLERTTFYKVGHHGSHNATPVTFVDEILRDDVWAAASVKPRGNWNIPKPELMAELRDKGNERVLRSDEQPPGPIDGVAVDWPMRMDIVVPTGR